MLNYDITVACFKLNRKCTIHEEILDEIMFAINTAHFIQCLLQMTLLQTWKIDHWTKAVLIREC